MTLLQYFKGAFNCLQISFKLLHSHIAFHFIVELKFMCILKHAFDLILIKPNIFTVFFNFQISVDNLFLNVRSVIDESHLLELALDELDDLPSLIEILDIRLNLLHLLYIQNLNR
jgi:hypothetical protein